jgi:hypothetical protein
MLLDVFAVRLHELFDASEVAITISVLRDTTKSSLHDVQPGGALRGGVNGKPLVPLNPEQYPESPILQLQRA